jgi:hypothetical protein
MSGAYVRGEIPFHAIQKGRIFAGNTSPSHLFLVVGIAKHKKNRDTHYKIRAPVSSPALVAVSHKAHKRKGGTSVRFGSS